jgi:uncharacterized protein (DUF1330 family)
VTLSVELQTYEEEQSMIKAAATVSFVFSLIFSASFFGPSARADGLKGYLVGLVTVTSKDWVAEYRKKNARLLAKYGGRILARGKPMVALEGTAPDVQTVVIVEFPSVKQAKAWHSDPEYHQLAKLRQTGSSADFFLVEGMAQ